MFNYFQQSIFGLDLSDLSLKIAALKKRKQDIILTSYGRTEIPPGIIEKGEIKKETELISLIKKSLTDIKGSPLKTKFCAVSLPETEAFVRVIQLPILNEKEIGEAIKWEAEANIPMPLEEIYLDWQIIGQNDNKQNILIGALPKNLVDEYLKAFKKTGLTPLIFEIESLATARAIVKNGPVSLPLLIVDLGIERTSFIIFYKSTVYFTTSLPFGNNQLIAVIAQSLNIDTATAKKIKIGTGLDKAYPQNKLISTALEPFLNEISQKIKELSIFFKKHSLDMQSPTNQISETLLCGGGANLNGLAGYIHNKTKINTKVANPWVNILQVNSKELPELSYDESITYTTALGLALGGLNFDKKL